MMKAMRDRLRKVAAGTPARKKAKRPDAARGKTTKRGALRKIVESISKRPKMVGMPKDMSPGKVKAITGKAVMGASRGMGGAGLMGIARKLKPRAKNLMRKKAKK